VRRALEAPSPSSAIPNRARPGGTFSLPRRADPAEQPGREVPRGAARCLRGRGRRRLGRALSAVLNRARTAGLGGGAERLLPSLPVGRWEPPQCGAGLGGSLPSLFPPSPISSRLGGSSPVLPGCGEEKIAGGEGGEVEKKYLWNGWRLPGIASSPAAAFSPDPRDRQV